MGQPYTKILIEDLDLVMSIGIHSHEKANTQRVLVNLELYTDQAKQPQNDEIEETVCYETVSNAITQMSQEKHYNLAETFAENIAAYCLSNQRVQQVCVCVKKPDIMDNTSAVGVEVFRARKN